MSHRGGSPGHSPIAKGNASTTSNAELQRSLQQEALELQLEMERIKERRRLLDEQRRRLRNESDRLLSPGQSHSASHSLQRSTHSRRSMSAASQSAASHHYDCFSVIPTERERRDHRTHTAELQMKQEIRQSLDQDSTLVGGYFLLKDNYDRNATFTRAPRFRKIIGMKGQYYLDHDVQRMQQMAKQKGEHFSVQNRGKAGCNVTCQWNSTGGGTAPGPGTYTPRYQKLAPKSRLAGP